MRWIVWVSILSFATSGFSQQPTNRLIHSQSPYLLLHAHNPVDWYPWGDEAFEKARREQKPIFLSIGYYTCHWCHVMEQESYSNPEIAAVLNKYFVAIKVDREERPDIDRLYIAYLERTTGNAGWPLNVLLTPALQPVAGGVYFPPDKLKKLLQKTADAWAKDRDHITQQAARAARELVDDLSKPLSATASPQVAALDKAFKQIAASYDHINHGFGWAPKFPTPVIHEFLLRTYVRTGQKQAVDMTLETLRSMAAGGIHDQLGGGFHRYATDTKWRVPHFEKMLYDQAQLAVVYLEAYQITHDTFFANVARDTLDFSLRELQLPGGGFGSALDADSEGREGAYYVWSRDEIGRVLGSKDAEAFGSAYGVDRATDNVLFMHHAPETNMVASRKLLLEARAKRPRPPLDDKVVTAWNGMMIAALARGSRVLDDPKYLAVAQSTARFLESHLLDNETKRLWRSYRGGTASAGGFLDDYTGLIRGLTELYQADFDVHWLQWARQLQRKQDELFWDGKQGAYYDVTGSDPALLARTREAADNAEPSPNSTAAMNLQVLAEITGNTDWEHKTEQLFQAFGSRLSAQPDAVTALASALDFHFAHTRQILIAGDMGATGTKDFLRIVNERYMPNSIVLLADGASGQAQLAAWRPEIGGAHMLKGKPTAYICENFVCKLPTSDPAAAVKLLDAK